MRLRGQHKIGLLCIAILQCSAAFAQLTIPPDTLICKGSTVNLRANVTSAINTTHYAFVKQPVYEWDTLVTYQTLLNVKDDDIRGPFNIGFNFSFLCGDYAQFYIGSNGWISFGVKNDVSWKPMAIPNTFYEVPKNAIMGPWEDWDPSKGGKIIYGLKGTAPNRRMIISWIDMPMYSCPDLKGTCQIVIHESNLIKNNILFKPGNAGCTTTGTNATQGLQNMAGTVGFAVAGRNGTLWSAQMESMLFLPDIDTNNITWLETTKKGDVAKVYHGTEIKVSPDTTATYLVSLYKCTGEVIQKKMNVTVVPPLVATFVNKDTIICKGQEVLLTASVSGGKPQSYLYHWINDGINTWTGQYQVKPDSTYRQKLVVTDQCSSPDTETVMITVRPPLSLNVFKDSTICFGQTLDVIPRDSGGYDAGRYIDWGAGIAAHKIFMPKQDTAIHLELKDNCTLKTEKADVNVKVRKALQVAIMSDTVICSGDTLVLQTTASGGDSAHYRFTWNNGIGDGNLKKIVPDSSRLYKLVLQDACTPAPDSDDVYVRVRRAPQLSVRSDSTICKGQALELYAHAINGDTDGVRFTWDHGLGQNNFITVIPQGSLHYKVQMQDKCLAFLPSDSVAVTVRPPLHVQARDTLICYGNAINLAVSGSGGYVQNHQYHWNTGSSGNTLNGVNPLHKTTYRVVLSDGCTQQPDTAAVTVDVRSPLMVSLPGDTTLCKGSTVILNANASGGTGTYSYQWNGDMAGNKPYFELKGKSDTLVVLKIDDACSDPAYDTITVHTEANPQADFTHSELLNCGSMLMGFAQQSVYRAGSAFTWTFPDGSHSNDSNTTYRFTASGMQQVNLQVVSPRGCTDAVAKSIQVTVKPSVKADFTLPENGTDILHPEVVFHSQSADSLAHYWVFGQTGITASALSPVMIFPDTGSYLVTLIVQSKAGCTDTISKWLRVEDTYTLFVPNSFTPNNDGVNDVFEPAGRNVKTFKMYIIDRGGNIVFETDNLKHAWNGRVQNNVDWPIHDVLMYRIIATDMLDLPHEYAGTVTMLR